MSNYTIKKKDQLLAAIFRKIYKNQIIPKKVKKLSGGYGCSNDILRWYIERYYGVKVGKYTTFYDDILQDASYVESIGSFCSIAKNVHFTEGNHPLNCITTSPILYNDNFAFCSKDISLYDLEKRNGKSKIGNDVWIGRDVTILPSVNIGDGAVIGTGAVVNKDIPPYAIAVGVPAKVIKYRFSPNEIEILLRTKWWDWPDDMIKENLDSFYKPKLFLDRFE